MISDCDSMPETEGDEVIRLKPEKDDTDTQSCLREVFPPAAAARQRSSARPADASTICSQISRCSRRRERWEGD